MFDKRMFSIAGIPNLFGNLFFSFAGEGGGAAGGEGGGTEGAPPSGVKEDVTPETHYADEKGVPYYNRYRELEGKLAQFKDVDLDLFNRAKGLDLDALEKSHRFFQLVHSDKAKAAKILEILADKTAVAAASGGKENPELQAMQEKIEQLQRYIQSKEQSSWMAQYDKSVSESLAEALKGEEFKVLGGKLSDFDKKVVCKLVDDLYDADARSEHPKLSLNDIPKLVQGVLKELATNRGNSAPLRNDRSPDPMRSGPTGHAKPKPMTEGERIDSMVNFMQQQAPENAS